MPQRNQKKNSNRKRSILKEERTFERKSKQNIEDTYDKDTDMECGAVWSRKMDNEERRYKKTWRRMEKVSWTEHKTNEEILETIGEERSLIRTIKTIDVKNAFFNVFYFWNVFYFLVEKFCILLNTLKILLNLLNVSIKRLLSDGFNMAAIKILSGRAVTLKRYHAY